MGALTGKGSTPRKTLRASGKVLGAIAFIGLSLFPLLWMILSGFKEKTEVTRTPLTFLPDSWLVENYLQVLRDPGFVKALGLTFACALIFAIVGITINSMAAYVFARVNFPGKRVIWPIVIGTMFIPNMTILLTSFLVVTELHMINTLAVIIVPGLASAAQIFFLRQFYLGIPVALEEAALLDGAGRWKVYLHIFVPMSRGIFVVVGMTMFLAVWNSYIWPILTLTDPNMMLVQQYLGLFRGERGTEFGLLMAASTLGALPVIILFMIFQRQIIAGARISGMK